MIFLYILLTVLQPAKKKKCFGYTLVEYGKGIDCNGDTIKVSTTNPLDVWKTIQKKN